MQTTQEPAKIIVSEGEGAEFVVELGERLTIGRAPGNDLVLQDSMASRNHAEIRRMGDGRYRITDIGSSNGTWLNGRRLTVPRELENGDQIAIGGAQMRFIAPRMEPQEEPSMGTGTALFLRSELVIVMVADIRNYTAMSEVLPNREFSLLISDWFRESSEIIKKHGGTVDKFIGDAVMSYWVSLKKSDPSSEINASLNASLALFDRAALFSSRLSREFPGHEFRIGIGMSMGDAMMGNVGSGENQSFTVVGDSVNIAFRLESLTKTKGVQLILMRNMVESADRRFRFRDLGETEVKGRHEPVPICALEQSGRQS